MPCPHPSALQDYLDGRATPDDQHAIRAHLETCAECRALVLSIAPSEKTPPTVPGHDQKEGELLMRGERVGRYIVLDRLGAGGMGVVYAAYDPELDRKLALKLIRHSPADGDTAVRELEERLMREAQAMARVAHPNVVTVHDVGRHCDQVFIAMEMIDGETLAQWLHVRRATREIVDVFLRAGRGLAAAHSVGLVHRDFKPNNVMIDRYGRVLVMDFGLARPSGTRDEATPRSSPSRLDDPLTRPGALVGTPAFMAPEQLARQPLSARTDQFSFCVALYAALCGTRPFAGADTDELREAIVARRLQRPTRKVAAWLLRVVERGLDPDPAARWSSMDALLVELARDPARSRRRWLAAGGAAMAVAALLLGLQLVRRRHSQLCRGQEQKLVGIWDASRRQAVQATLLGSKLPSAAGVTASVLRTLDDYTEGWVTTRERVCEATRKRGEQSEALLDLRMQCLDDRLDEVRALGDAIAGASGPALEHAVDAAHTLSAHGDCLTLSATGAQPLPADPTARATFIALRRSSDDVAALNRMASATEALRRATELSSDPRLAIYPALRAELLFEEAQALVRAGKLDAATQRLDETVQLGLRTRNDRLVARSWLLLGQISGNYLHHYDEAFSWERRAEAWIEGMGKPADLDQRRLYVLASIYGTSGQLELAESASRAVLALAEKAAPPNDLRIVDALDAVANVLADEGRYAESVPLAERSLALLDKSGLGQTLRAAEVLNNLALTYQDMARHADAERVARRALAIEEADLEPDHQYIVRSLHTLGAALLVQGRLDEAEAIFTRALPLAQRRRAEQPAIAPELLSLLGQIRERRHQRELALALYRQSLAQQPSPVARGEVRFSIAQLLWDLGRDRRSAVAMAVQARTELATHPTTLRQIDQWLAQHRL
jgi:tetratricopeptide (TPR) repeat protein